MKLLLAVAIILAIPLTSLGNTCPADATLSVPSSEDLKTDTEEILRRLNTEYAKSQPADFCKRNLLMRFLNSRDKPPEGCERWSLERLEAYADSVAKPKGTMWEKTTRGTSAGVAEALDDFRFKYRSRPLQAESAQDVTQYFSVPVEFNSENESKIRENLATLDKNKRSDIPDLFADSGIQSAACAIKAFRSTASCAEGLRKIVSKVTTSDLNSSTRFINVDLWKKLYGSRNYREGLRLAALKLSKMVNGSIKQSANVFDDIRDAFIQSGMTKEQATDASWDTLGLIANGGPNTFQRAAALDGFSQQSEAIGYIALAMIYLDNRKLKQGMPLYSYPSNIQTSCDNRKPYHFWMSAYLARSLVKEEGLNRDGAIAAVYLSQIGYQMKREVGDEKIEKKLPNAILTRAAFDPAHQIVRTDIAYSAVGAYFGVESAKETLTKPISVDDVIVALVKGGGVLPALDPEEARHLPFYSFFRSDAQSRWNKIFVPDIAIENVSQQLGKK